MCPKFQLQNPRCKCSPKISSLPPTHTEPHPSWLLIARLLISLLGTISPLCTEAQMPDSIPNPSALNNFPKKGGPRTSCISEETKMASISLPARDMHGTICKVWVKGDSAFALLSMRAPAILLLAWPEWIPGVLSCWALSSQVAGGDGAVCVSSANLIFSVCASTLKGLGSTPVSYLMKLAVVSERTHLER